MAEQNGKSKKTVTVRGLEIGSGLPKICVPVAGTTKEEIRSAASAAAAVRPDMVEWRMDYLREPPTDEALLECLAVIRGIIGPMPLLFTFRTAEEGGRADLSWEKYRHLNLLAAKSGRADLVDIQLFKASDLYVGELVTLIHRAGAAVIGSSHDFSGTPGEEEMIQRLRKMQKLDMDITKIAVMPSSAEEVLRLMMTGIRMNEELGDRPCVTISMGRMGSVTRLCGSLTGSAITFASALTSSAPGQISALRMREILEVL